MSAIEGYRPFELIESEWGGGMKYRLSYVLRICLFSVLIGPVSRAPFVLLHLQHGSLLFRKYSYIRVHCATRYMWRPKWVRKSNKKTNLKLQSIVLGICVS